VDGSLVQTGLVSKGPPSPCLRVCLNPCNSLPFQVFIGGLIEFFNAARWSLRMLGLRDPIARSDIVQHEITKGMDGLVAECTGHSFQVAPRLGAGVERLDWRPRCRRGEVGVVTDGAAEQIVIPEEFFAFLGFPGPSEREVSGRRLGRAQEARKGFYII